MFTPTIGNAGRSDLYRVPSFEKYPDIIEQLVAVYNILRELSNVACDITLLCF
jgi:hypothetical protein